MHHDLLYARDAYVEYVIAMRRVRNALQRGRADDVKTWVAIAERLLNMQETHDALRIASEKRTAWQAEQPHRLKLLEGRARFPR